MTRTILLVKAVLYILNSLSDYTESLIKVLKNNATSDAKRRYVWDMEVCDDAEPFWKACN